MRFGTSGELGLPFYLRTLIGWWDLGIFRNPDADELQKEIMLGRASLLYGVGFLVLLPLVVLDKYFGVRGIGLYINWALLFGLIFTVRLCWGWLMVKALGAVAVMVTILSIALAPIAVISYLGVRLYSDLHLAFVFPDLLERDLNLTADVSIPVSILSFALTCWCILRAQPYIDWSVAGLAKAIIEPLIAFKILPFLFAFLLWLLAPLFGQYIHDGDFWARIIGAATIAVTMPSILWGLTVNLLTGLDRFSKVGRTRGQDIYGGGGFADPWEASQAMRASRDD